MPKLHINKEGRTELNLEGEIIFSSNTSGIHVGAGIENTNFEGGYIIVLDSGLKTRLRAMWTLWKWMKKNVNRQDSKGTCAMFIEEKQPVDVINCHFIPCDR